MGYGRSGNVSVDKLGDWTDPYWRYCLLNKDYLKELF
jgi:hypothetical protein